MKPVIVVAALSVLAVSACDWITPPPDPPGIPTRLVAEAQSRTTVRVTWSAPASGDDVAEYELERSSGGGFAAVADPVTAAMTYTDTGLSAEQDYAYRLRACNEGGCSDFAGPATARTFGTIQITTDSLPRGAVGQAYTGALTAEGAGEDYTWSVVTGALPDGLVLTESTGLISGTPSTSDTAEVTFRARSIDDQTADATLTVEIRSALPIAIETVVLPPVIVGGPYEVELKHSGGGAERTWSVVAGSLPAGITLDAAGTLAGTPTAVDTAVITLRVESFGESDEKELTLTVVPHNEDRFDITPLEAVDLPAGIRPHVDSALARWERVITGDVQPGYVPPGTFDATECLGFGDIVNGTTLDDIIILVTIQSIDGPGGTLAQAGPCAIRTDGSTDPNIPAFGLAIFDIDDLQPITGTETLTDLIFHEIGHVLGYGSLWENPLDLVTGAGTADPRYTGSGAVAEYQDLGRTGDVPLETEGGEGTADVHWRESVFGVEVMTGFIQPVGVDNLLSRVTIASMEDLGYTVDRDQADSYSLSALALREVAGEPLGYDILYRGPIRVLDLGGALRRAQR